MDISQFTDFLRGLPDQLLDDASEVVADTAQEYFKESFTRKAFDGNPWEAARRPKRTGSLLIDSGALLNSIRPVVVTPERVVISAGNDKVTYASVHNEGFIGSVPVPAHLREAPKNSGKFYDVRAHTRHVNIPQRQFMGDSRELADIIHERISGLLDTLLNF